MLKINKQSKYKQHIPLIFLIFVSSFWAFYYSSKSFLNDYGQANFEWLFMLDGLLVLPVLCWLCIDDKKTAALKALVFMCLAVLIGSFIIPEESKLLMPYLESGRYVILAILVLFEASVVVTVYWAIQAGLKVGCDPDHAINEPISKWLGSGMIAQIMSFEARMWSFLILNKCIKKESYIGDIHFSYHKKDGAQSNALGLLWLIAIEIPLVHLLLHFMWSPFAANVITGLTLFGLCFMVAGYRANSRRPISIYNTQLIIRMDLLNTHRVNLVDILSVQPHHDYVPRQKTIKRFNLANNPNIAISLKLNNQNIKTIYLGVDSPAHLIEAINRNISTNDEQG